MASIKSIKKKSVAGEVFDQLKDMIATGTWEPGTKIPSEIELSKQFNVSRNTIRSAIQELKGIGVVKTKQGQGTFLCDSAVDSVVKSIIPIGLLSDEEVIEIAQFRKTVELGSVQFAAVNRTEEDLKSIKKALKMMKDNLNNYQQYSKADYKFHLAIARASQNRYFYRVYISLKDIIYRHFEKMSKDLGTDISIEAHEKIYEAIKDKNEKIAVSVTMENINMSLDLITNRMK